MNTTKNGQPVRGQVVPYADQRAYTDRLNTLFTPAGWTRRYTLHTSANFERSKDQKIVAKVLVSCELTIFGVGLHSATGEEWADNHNIGTAAEAQAYKRTCSCFGLGRYLYYFEGVWVDSGRTQAAEECSPTAQVGDTRGLGQGLRPKVAGKSNGANNGAKVQHCGSEAAALTKQIEGKAELLGHGLYRGLLRDLARVWNPQEIQEISLLQKVLEHMPSAERGLRRVQAALDKTGPVALAPTLKTIGLSSLERVDNLETLKRIVLELEGAAENKF